MDDEIMQMPQYNPNTFPLMAMFIYQNVCSNGVPCATLPH